LSSTTAVASSPSTIVARSEQFRQLGTCFVAQRDKIIGLAPSGRFLARIPGDDGEQLDDLILGLGDLELRQKERIHPHAGRLDLLLQDSEDRRYEVELQLGSTDETHIIRTIEYRDNERKRYPRYDHRSVNGSPISLDQ
jgi:hypothetical protein